MCLPCGRKTGDGSHCSVVKLNMSPLLNSSQLSQNKTGAINSITLPDNSFISDQLLYQLDILLNCFLIQVLCVFGIVGNVINVIVLSRQGLKDSNVVLFSLSVIDLLGSVFRQGRRLKCIVATLDTPASVTVDTIGSVFFILPDNWCLASSIFHITAIAVERCLAVCAPFSVAAVFTPRRVKIMLVSLYAYTVVILSPLFYRLTYAWETDPLTNATVARVVYTRFYSDHVEVVNLFSTIFYNNICTTAPLLTILICSAIIVVKLLQARPQRLSKLSSQRSDSLRLKDRKVAKMLLTVCVATVISCLPTSLLAMYLVYSQATLFTGNLFYVIRSLQDVLYQVTASVNFIIYVSLSSKFNRIYKTMFLCCDVKYGR
ncbi:hypothetical protein Btru_046949 [Bulinus truncatus]|nr:hypothetical protein Btru_046949 [Bulinus truncatus]